MWKPTDIAPEDGQVCVVYDPTNPTLSVWPAVYDKENNCFTAGIAGAAGWFEYKEVTHWMPLPELPKEK